MISTDLIKQLRESTGAGVMEVKKALDEANGDLTKAAKIIEERGLAKAAKKADRETHEGYIGVYHHMNGKVAAMVSLLCETDFVAMNDEFRALAKEIAMQVASMQPETVEELLGQEYIRDGSKTIHNLIQSLSGKIGEKMVVGEFKLMRL